MSIWNSNVNRDAADGIDSLTHSPSGGRHNRLWLGLAIPMALLGYAIHGYCAESIIIPSLSKHTVGWLHTMRGQQAIGTAYVCGGVALFLHFNFFWGLLIRFHAQLISQVGKALACVTILYGLGFSLWYLLRF